MSMIFLFFMLEFNEERNGMISFTFQLDVTSRIAQELL